MKIDRKYLAILTASTEFTQALRHSRFGASGSDIVNLLAHKDDIPVDRTSVDTSLVCGVHNIEVVEDLADVLFPQSTGFWGVTTLQMVVLAVSQSLFYAFNKVVLVTGIVGAEDV
jgi:hypothetical protein